MTPPREDGGPAFPKPGSNFDDGEQAGMTLRDYFAGQALGPLVEDAVAIARQVSGAHISDESATSIALAAYGMADAMLRARVKP